MADYEKPSRHGQWQEKSEKPIASRPMNKEEIEEHRQNLIASYECDDNDIIYDFQKILDSNDEDRDDCLWLKYKMKCVVSGKPTIREIFSIKLPIPDEIRRSADQIRKEQAMRDSRARRPNNTLRALPAPVHAVAAASVAAVTEPRPRLKKPVRGLRKP